MSKLILSHNGVGWSADDEQGNKLPEQEIDEREQWGLYDTQENVWLGDKSGPKLYNRRMAKIAARVTEKLLGYEPGRVRERLFDESNLRLRDEVDVKMSAEEAIRRLESGEL